ncbi:MAG TPA: FKBP-type peptidyl-prolyl cis-trans isomerase [Streptosporangiaceae bacterium]
MRRIAAMIVLPLLAAGVLAGCGGSTGTTSAGADVAVTGAFDQAPVIKIPAAKASSKLSFKTVIHGTGPALHTTDAFIGNYAIYVWSGTAHRLAQSSFGTTTHPGNPTLFSGQLLPGLSKALIGQKMGSRVLAVIPPKEGFGTSGNPQVGIKGTDTLVFVVDLIKDFASNDSAAGTPVSDGGKGLPTVTAVTGSAPTIKMPSGQPPTKLVTKTLVQGTGPVVTKGQTVVVQYVGAIWASGKVFDASWRRGQPFGFVIGSTPSQVIPGWDLGLTGQKVGSRVMLVIPPADGYGKTGNTQAGIKGTDTLVFVVDILGGFS